MDMIFEKAVDLGVATIRAPLEDLCPVHNDTDPYLLSVLLLAGLRSSQDMTSRIKGIHQLGLGI